MSSQIAGLYDMEDTLGSGHFAVVKSARHVFTGLRVAVKVIDKLKLDEVSKAHLYQEVRCMKLVTHPNIIRLYEVIDTQTKLYLIQELGDGGDLYDFIMKHPNGIDENLGRRIFRQLVCAILYCHKLHVVHRDLKPENLVFCSGSGQEPLRVKLTDFGLSRTFLPGELIESSCGSLEYSAPEILLGDSYDPPKVDVWSLGVILFMLICGRSPFASGGASETLTHIMDAKYYIPHSISETCKNLISTMLVVDAPNRSSLDQVAAHPWLHEGCWEDLRAISLPTISNFEEIPEDESEYILHRMEIGGYGSREDILTLLSDSPYGSTSATFFLLAEAERHRKLNRPTGLPATPSRQRKASMPIISPPAYLNGPVSMFMSPNITLTTTPTKSHGSAETGVLRPRGTPVAGSNPKPHSILESPFSTHVTPIRGTCMPYHSPRVGVGGEQLSQWNSPKPAFPLNIQGTEPPIQEHIDHTPTFRPTRQLSVFEEESENESLPELPPISPHTSPLRSPRSRRLLNARSSPNITLGAISKSDVSEEEEDDDDDIVELFTSSGRFPSKSGTFPRMSPASSPLLTSRRSPTTTSWTGSSDEELSSIFESARKHRSKRMPYRKRSIRLSRVDSLGSDDGGQADRQRRLRKSRDNLIKMRGYGSVPNTPADVNAPESITELLENMRKQRSSSMRTDSSLSDGGKSCGDMSELANSMVSKFELSDEEGDKSSMDTDTDHKERTAANITLRSAFCSIL